MDDVAGDASGSEHRRQSRDTDQEGKQGDDERQCDVTGHGQPVIAREARTRIKEGAEGTTERDEQGRSHVSLAGDLHIIRWSVVG